MKIGVQLFTLSPRMKTREDFCETLKKVSEMGFRYVQVSGAYPFEPEELRYELDKNNLQCVLTHQAVERIEQETEAVVRENAILGCRNIGIGSFPTKIKSIEEYKSYLDPFIVAAKKIHDMGAVLHYHNHYWEYHRKNFNGSDVVSMFAEDIAPELLEFTLDLGWVAFGGSDVLKVIRDLRGRISRVHLKDWAPLPQNCSIPATSPVYHRPIYEGVLDYDSYIKALCDAGVEYALFEQDRCYDEDCFDCLKRSCDNVLARFPDIELV